MSPSIAFIGAGRLATTLATALSRSGVAVLGIASSNPESARRLAASLSGCKAMSADDTAEADLVFLTVPDDHIATVAETTRWRRGQMLAHCSGATEVAALDAAARQGALTGGFHPMQNFADPQRALALLAGSSVAIEGPPEVEAALSALAERLGMAPLFLPPGARALYHGSASFAASFLLSMLQEAVAVWGAFGIDETRALQALLPVAQGTLQAAAGKGLAGALAGPISRGDVGVVERHLRALEQLGPAHAAFYADMSRRQLELARASGRLSEAQLQRFALLLAKGEWPLVAVAQR